MSYDLELAAQRAIDRLRHIAAVRAYDGNTWIAQALTEIADALEAPLRDELRAQQKWERERN